MLITLQSPGYSQMTHHTKYSEMILLLIWRWSWTQLAWPRLFHRMPISSSKVHESGNFVHWNFLDRWKKNTQFLCLHKMRSLLWFLFQLHSSLDHTTLCVHILKWHSEVSLTLVQLIISFRLLINFHNFMFSRKQIMKFPNIVCPTEIFT